VKFARVLRPEGRVVEGVVVDGSFVGFGAAGLDPHSTIASLLPDWDGNMHELATVFAAPRRAGDADSVPVADCHFLPPVAARQIFQVALNYSDHAAEMNLPLPTRPFVFLGLPSALCGPDDEVQLPADSDQLDWELELAFTVKQDVYRVDAVAAVDLIAGYLIVNDLTARDQLHQAGDGRTDYVRAKNRPGYLPAGPFLVSADVVDASALNLRLKVNGHLHQNGRTADMIFSPGQLLAEISAQTRVLAGDLVLTGTPAGTGHASKRYLSDGDLSVGSITGLGSQHTRYRRQIEAT
jgi:2-keto-4-pentenoate hydratase/2-oxohepta-3-ene-1,7-dioic acid hydratase in catechol pathway